MPPSELWLQGLSLFGATFLDEQCPFVSFPHEFFIALLISCLNFFIQLRMSIMKICLHRKATISDSLHASTSATSYKALTASTKVSVGSLIVLCLAQRRKSHCLFQTLLSVGWTGYLHEREEHLLPCIPSVIWINHIEYPCLLTDFSHLFSFDVHSPVGAVTT